MKKFFAILGGIVAATSVLAIAAVILKKIKLSFSIESAADDDFGFDSDDFHDVSVSIDDSMKEGPEEPAETEEKTETEEKKADAE